MSKLLYMVTPDDVETQILDWGTFQWLNAPDVTGSKHMAVGIGLISEGFGHERHNHVGSDEFIYFLSGTVKQTIETPENGFEEKILKAGDLIFIPDGCYHSTINVGKDDVKFVCCYLNAGPEKDLRAAANTILPPKNKRD